MNNHFSQIPKANLPRSSFDRSFSHKTTFDAGKLVPIYWEEVLPGDSYNCQVNLFARMTSPLTVPVMDNMYIDVQFFYVPFRLVWDNFERFMGAQDDPDDSTDYLVPTFNSGAAVPPSAFSGSLADYFGLPISNSQYSHNCLIYRAYWLIWNEWYRDQNLQDSVRVYTGDQGAFTYATVGAGSGSVSTSLFDIYADYNGFNPYMPAPRNKRHDYFTSCLPWPQKGPGVELPLGDSAPVFGTGQTLTLTNSASVGMDAANTVGGMYGASGGSLNVGTIYAGAQLPSSLSGGVPLSSGGIGIASKEQIDFSNSLGDDLTSGIYADLSRATAATINSLRQAFQLQRMFERDARGGTRFREILRSHYGVISPDARLQIPEYLGGFSQPIMVNPVAQTSSTDSNSPQGNLSAFAVTGAARHGFTKSFVEHGYIIGLASVRADLTYSQGINRLLNHTTRETIYFPALAHLGEQAVLNKEIYAQGTDADDAVFGYQERWAEYRYHPNMVTGLMRPQADQSLAIWNLTQDFESLPQLNSEFIRENPPMDRVSAVPSQPDFLLDCYFRQKVARVMPTYSVPGLIDHF